MKTIWVINQTAGTLNSGWGERHLMLARQWVKRGYDVKIISGSYNHLFINQPDVKNKTFTIERIEKKITFCWIKIPNYKNAGFRKYFSNLIFMLKLFFLPVRKLGVPSYIIVSSMPIFPIINGYVFKKRFKSKKLIVEIRDLWPLTPIYLEGYSRFHPLIKILALFEKFAYKKSDEIVSLLPNAHLHINKISNNPKKIHWIPNGIDEKGIDHEKLNSELIQKIPKNKFVIGYAGTLGMANALEYFISASKILEYNDNIHFLLVGSGRLKKKFQRQTKHQQNITFIPKIPKAQVQSVLSYFDICFVGRYDNKLYDFGVSYNKYFDYMMSKTPVLVSSNLIKDPVELSRCGITVKPESPKAIADGILTFYKIRKTERDKIGIKGYDYVKKYHSFTVLSRYYLSLFK